MKRWRIRARIAHTIIWSILFAALIAPVSHAQTPKDAGYLCTSEMAVGFEYNTSLKNWEGVTLDSEGPFSKFILRLKSVKERVRRNASGENEDVTDYLVTITKTGANAAIPCTFGGTGINSRIIVVGDNDNVVCTAKRRRLTFNLESKRFISVHLYGYVDGEDGNENMPTMSGGTCKKID
jgi:hypothetical protein